MSRRPRRNRPPRLDLPRARPAAPRSPHAAGPPEPRRTLVDARVTGAHRRLGREAVRAAIRALVAGDPRARLGCDGLDDVTAEEVAAALTKTHGWDPDATRGAIDPDATVTAIRSATARLEGAARAGARLAFATTRPASLLFLDQWLAAHLAECGATVLSADRASIDDAPGRELWWIGDVAVVTDGRSLLAYEGWRGGDDWLFALGNPDLVVADRGFAGSALRAGIEVVAWADLDAPALSVAAARGAPVLLVPLDEQQPAAAYDAVIALLAEGGRPEGP